MLQSKPETQRSSIVSVHIVAIANSRLSKYAILRLVVSAVKGFYSFIMAYPDQTGFFQALDFKSCTAGSIKLLPTAIAQIHWIINNTKLWPSIVAEVEQERGIYTALHLGLLWISKGVRCKKIWVIIKRSPHSLTAHFHFVPPKECTLTIKKGMLLRLSKAWLLLPGAPCICTQKKKGHTTLTC